MARLLIVSGKSIDLPDDGGYVIGRHPDCEIVVSDCSCSRRHARVSVLDAGRKVYVEDLSSRNGTYLAGHLLTERTLVRDGAQIRTGSTTFVVSYAGARSEPPRATEDLGSDTMWLDAAPALLETAPASDAAKSQRLDLALSGAFEAITLIELVRLIWQLRRSGKLSLRYDDGSSGQMQFRSGELLSVRHGDECGVTAFEALSRRQGGRFDLIETTAPVDRDVEISTAQLILDLDHSASSDVVVT